jgi:hypothetical protein
MITPYVPPDSAWHNLCAEKNIKQDQVSPSTQQLLCLLNKVASRSGSQPIDCSLLQSGSNGT